MPPPTASSKDRLTTIIDGVTYDITDFVETHPGGSDMLMLAAGRDCTIMFYSYHRDVEKAKAVLRKLPVVDNKNASQYKNTIDTPLYRDLKKRVNKYFEETKQISRGNELMWFKSLALVALTIFLYWFGMIQGYWILCPFLGICIAINGLAIQHDANHGAFSKYQTLNRIAGFVDDLIGGSSLMWRHQHVIAHHAYPNHHTLDADTYSNFPLMRMNPKLPTVWYLQYQHIYGPILYSLIGIGYLFGDILSYVNSKYFHIDLQPLRPIDRVTFIVGKLLHLLFFVFVPIYVHGLSALWTLYLPMQLVGGDFLATVFAVSHNTEETEYNMNENSDWAELQIKSSANWSVHSTMWWLVSGGLNFQIEHHLFPGICHVHYPAISKIVQQVCKEYKLPYQAYPTFREIYTDHINTLKKLGSWKQE